MKKFEEFYHYYKMWEGKKKPKDKWKAFTKISEEVGEVAEGLFALSGNEKKINKLKTKNQTPIESLREEIADVIITSLNLATACGIPHDDIFEAGRDKSENRAIEDAFKFNLYNSSKQERDINAKGSK